MPYSKIDPDQMILRDHLAYDRTVLANERTLLSYLRTSIALLAAGGTLMKIFPDEPGMVKLGFVLLAVGAVAAVVGVTRFIRVKKRIGVAYDKLEEIEQGND
jgi:putative membrane protein